MAALTTYARLIAGTGSSISSDRGNTLIKAISALIERECGRKFGFAIVPPESPELHKGGGSTLYLRRYPIRSVESVLVSGSEVTDWTNDPELLANGELYRPGGWSAEYLRARYLTGRPAVGSESLSISVAYTGGFILPEYSGITDAENNPDGLETDFPADLESAVWDSVISLYSLSQQSGRILKREKTPGGGEWEWSVTDTQAKRPTLTPFTLALCEAYTREYF